MLDIHSRKNRKSDGPISIVTSPFMAGYFRKKVQPRPWSWPKLHCFGFIPSFPSPTRLHCWGQFWNLTTLADSNSPSLCPLGSPSAFLGLSFLICTLSVNNNCTCLFHVTCTEWSPAHTRAPWPSGPVAFTAPLCSFCHIWVPLEWLFRGFLEINHFYWHSY